MGMNEITATTPSGTTVSIKSRRAYTHAVLVAVPVDVERAMLDSLVASFAGQDSKDAAQVIARRAALEGLADDEIARWSWESSASSVALARKTVARVTEVATLNHRRWAPASADRPVRVEIVEVA